MLIKQIIEFELRRPSPLIVHALVFCHALSLLQLVIVVTKQKSLKANLRVHY